MTKPRPDPTPPPAPSGPSGRERVLSRLEADVRHAWRELRRQPGGACPLFEIALRRMSSLLPCCVSTRPRSAAELVGDLRAALQDRHPEEIQVVVYSLEHGLVEAVRERRGVDRAQSLARFLTRPTS